jgi:PIN domain nuclease of toxin-antitoxin system
MRLLLDTHAVLWWLADDLQLSRTAKAAIDDGANELFVSAAVGYEIVYKQSRGRLAPLPENLNRRLQREGIVMLSISMDHAIAAAHLPGRHRDPWDRIMMAQAVVEKCHMVTVDKVFTDYGVPVIW